MLNNKPYLRLVAPCIPALPLILSVCFAWHKGDEDDTDIELVPQQDDEYLFPERMTVTFTCHWAAKVTAWCLVSTSDNIISLISCHVSYFHSKCSFCIIGPSISEWFNTAVFLSTPGSWKHLHCCCKMWCQVGPFQEKTPHRMSYVLCFQQQQQGTAWNN